MNRQTRTWITGLIVIVIALVSASFCNDAIKTAGTYWDSHTVSLLLSLYILYKGVSKVLKTID